MSLLILPTIALVSLLGIQADGGSQAVTALQKRYAELRQLVGENAPNINSELERQSAQKQFEALSSDIESAIHKFPERAWLKELKISLRLIAENLDLQFQPSPDSIIDKDNLYSKALSACFPNSNHARSQILLLDPGEPSFGLEGRIGLEGVLIVSKLELSNRFKASGKPITVHILNPASVEGHLLKVVIESREYSRRGKTHIFAISGWSVAYFRLDPSSNRFYLLKGTSGGI